MVMSGTPQKGVPRRRPLADATPRLGAGQSPRAVADAGTQFPAGVRNQVRSPARFTAVYVTRWPAFRWITR